MCTYSSLDYRCSGMQGLSLRKSQSYLFDLRLEKPDFLLFLWSELVIEAQTKLSSIILKPKAREDICLPSWTGVNRSGRTHPPHYPVNQLEQMHQKKILVFRGLTQINITSIKWGHSLRFNFILSCNGNCCNPISISIQFDWLLVKTPLYGLLRGRFPCSQYRSNYAHRRPCCNTLLHL